MSNEIGFSLSAGEFKNQQEDAEEMVKHLMRFTGLGITIEIDDGPWGDDGYKIKAHGRAPWMSSLKWFIEFVQEKGCSADLSMSDGLLNANTEAQWREGKCVYQKDRKIYYFSEKGDPLSAINYDDNDKEAITYKFGEKGPSLEDYLSEKAEALREKEADEDEPFDLPF